MVDYSAGKKESSHNRLWDYKIRDYNLADWKYEKLKEQIEEFQEDLPDSVDVCAVGFFWTVHCDGSGFNWISKSRHPLFFRYSERKRSSINSTCIAT